MSSITVEEIIPEGRIRKIVYIVFGVLGLVLSCIQVGIAAAQAAQPIWLTVAFAVYGFLAAGAFAKAQGNTPTKGIAVTATAGGIAAASGIEGTDVGGGRGL